MSSTAATEAAPLDPAEEMCAQLAKVRQQEPIRLGEEGAWHLYRYEDVRRVLSDASSFSSEFDSLGPLFEEFQAYTAGNIVNVDPPRHDRLRGLVVDAFTPRSIDVLEPKVIQTANDMLDSVPGDGRFDLVGALAYPLPVSVIADLLGVPAEDRHIFLSWFDGMLATVPSDGQLIDPQALAALPGLLRQMYDYVGEQARYRRDKHPTDDLMGRLVAAEVDGDRLSIEEIVGFTISLLLGGYVNTTSLISTLVYLLDKQPEVGAELRADRSLIPGAMEEVLRLRTPSTRLYRRTKTEIEIGGVTIPAGKDVIAWVSAANRDPERFADPDRLDIYRKTSGHVSFGHGLHFCIGSRLARLEVRLVMNVLMDRFRDISVDHDQPKEFLNPWVTNGLSRLPVVATR